MSDPAKTPGEPTQPGQTELEDLVARLEAAWLRGERPALENYIPQHEADRARVLHELVRADLEYRLRAHEVVRVESYFERDPELVRDREISLDLIAREYRLRKQCGISSPRCL